MRGLMLMLVLLAAAFAATLIVLYPEWRKLADTASGHRVASPAVVRLNGLTQTAQSTEQNHREPLEEIWSFQTRHRWQYRDPFLKRAVDQIGGTVCSDVVVAGNRVYFGSEGGFVYCLSLGGEPIWSFETQRAVRGLDNTARGRRSADIHCANGQRLRVEA